MYVDDTEVAVQAEQNQAILDYRGEDDNLEDGDFDEVD